MISLYLVDIEYNIVEEKEMNYFDSVYKRNIKKLFSQY